MSWYPGSGLLRAWEQLAAAWGDIEQSPQNIHLSPSAEPCSAGNQVCRTLLPCSCGSMARMSPVLLRLWGCLGTHGSGARSHQWAGKVNGCVGNHCVVCWDCAPAHRADRSCLALLSSSMHRQLCCAAEHLGTWLPASAFHSRAAGSTPGYLWGAVCSPCALSLQPLQAAGPLGPPAAMCSVSGQGSSRGAVPTAVLHPHGFGICDCPNYLLQ